ncbi:MAG: 4-hydroxy-tetrahydrodipicolinate reductase [Actinomycetota bacterium]|nr:4-hydroxy-tetrahydrodipicolinate reductase [Actinomycetota bacterium]
MRVAVFGICGKMGRAITSELLKESDIKVVAGFDRVCAGQDIGILLKGDKLGARIYDSYLPLESAGLDAVIDFTRADICVPNIHWALDHGINIIVGTTGISSHDLKLIEDKAKKGNSKVFIVPNFSIGAVLMIKLSGMIAPYFDNCEIIEMHHDQKQDAPSGTSISTAENICRSKEFNQQRLKKGESEDIEASRGGFVKGLHVHSVRLPGLLAHQKVIFGAKGQTFSLNHDSIDRAGFYPGVIMSLRMLEKLDNYTFGLDKLIQL